MRIKTDINGSKDLVCPDCGFWLSQSGEKVPTREQFMEFFRSDRLHEVLTAEDCREIFMSIMKGASDFDDAEELFNEILRDYETGKKAFVVSEDKTIDV